jgi:molybdopterin synthase catalytic subunit
MVTLTSAPIDPSAAYGLIAKGASGSVVFHYAVVKEQTAGNGRTSCIDYRAAAGAEQEMEGIVDELRQRWQVEDVLLIRRTGCLGIGDIISLVAASSPNSEDAFEACKQGISRLKKMSTIKKNEVYS